MDLLAVLVEDGVPDDVSQLAGALDLVEGEGGAHVLAEGQAVGRAHRLGAGDQGGLGHVCTA